MGTAGLAIVIILCTIVLMMTLNTLGEKLDKLLDEKKKETNAPSSDHP